MKRLAVAAGKLDPNYVPDLTLTTPVFKIGPHQSWADPKKIACEWRYVFVIVFKQITLINCHCI